LNFPSGGGGFSKYGFFAEGIIKEFNRAFAERPAGNGAVSFFISKI